MAAMVPRLLIALFAVVVSASHASACKYVRGPFLLALDEATASCKHELCGRIYPTDPAWMTRDASSCGRDPWMALQRDMRTALSGGGAVILGEAHDNPVHHVLQARLLDPGEVLLDDSRPRAVVMEQIRADQQSGIERFREFEINARRLGTLSELKRFLGWETSGWQKYDYDPLLTAIIAAKLPFYAGDPPRDTIKTLAKEGASTLATGEQTRLSLDKPLGEALDAASAAEIEESHCGMLPKAAIPSMAFAQRYRDAHLADATMNAAEAQGGAVLVTGNTHARTDRGVPWYLRSRAPDRKVVSVMLIEVEDGKADPEAYVPRDPDGRPAADFVVFTPRAERGDPCAELAEKAAKTPKP